MDLTEALDIKERWQEYTEELYKKSFSYGFTNLFSYHFCFPFTILILTFLSVQFSCVKYRDGTLLIIVFDLRFFDFMIL